MKVREFPVLTDDDAPLVDRLAVGLGDDPARVLAYLLRRADRPEFGTDPASLLAIQVGTELNRSAARDALDRLEARDLVDATAIRDETRGRPPKAWRATRGVDETVELAYRRHASALLERAAQPYPEGEGQSAGGGDSPPSVDSEASADASLSLALNWQPNGLHAPFFAAAATGAYADRGLAVAIEPNRGSRAALDGVVAGDADVGVAGAATLLRAQAAGDPVVPLAAVFQHATTAIYALDGAFDEPFERAAQLRGRRVGTPVDSEVGLLGRLFLSQAGVLDDVDVVDLGGEERDALLSGEVDAVTGSFADPRRLDAAGTPVESLLVAERFPLPGPTLVAATDQLADRRTELVAFLAATMEGWAAAERDPARAAAAVAARSDAAADRERRTFAEAVAEFGDGDAVRKRGWGWLRTDAWRRLDTALEQVGLLADESG